jgi:hypothetical protein
LGIPLFAVIENGQYLVVIILRFFNQLSLPFTNAFAAIPINVVVRCEIVVGTAGPGVFLRRATRPEECKGQQDYCQDDLICPFCIQRIADSTAIRRFCDKLITLKLRNYYAAAPSVFLPACKVKK